MSFDLLVRGGRLIDPHSNTDAPLDVAIAGGRVAAIDRDIPPDRARQVVDAKGGIVTPGLIDLHAHVYWGGTSLGVDADAIAPRSGTTTFVDAGSAGAGNFLGFRRHVIERSRARILAYMNISFAGIFGFASRLMVGECSNIVLCDPVEAVAAARDHADIVVGMKVRSGRIAGGNSGIAPVDLAVEAADKLHLPLMAHIDHPPPGRSEVIARLRTGDILTHCFKPFPNAPIDGRGFIRADALEARERGIVFDIGHGMGSFDFDVARAMMQGGFRPDVISSDVHILCIDGPAFDLLVCLSKFLALGLPIGEVIAAATIRPAAAIGRSDLGRVAVGGIADLAILRMGSGPVTYTDSVGQTLTATERLTSDGIVMGGAWWPNEGGTPDPSSYHPHVAHTHAALCAHHFAHHDPRGAGQR